MQHALWFITMLFWCSVVVLVIVITVHHFLYDKDPRKVPEYVKQSIQFSSSSSGSDSEDENKRKDISDITDEALGSSRRKIGKISDLLLNMQSLLVYWGLGFWNRTNL